MNSEFNEELYQEMIQDEGIKYQDDIKEEIADYYLNESL